MVEAAIAAMVAPLLAAAERVPRPLRLVVLLVISLIIREALCEEARQLLKPEQVGDKFEFSRKKNERCDSNE